MQDLGKKNMKTFKEALSAGFITDDDQIGSHVFWFGDKHEYELRFEPLLFDNQYYVALYKNQDLLTEKVVIKPGYIKKDGME